MVTDTNKSTDSFIWNDRCHVMETPDISGYCFEFIEYNAALVVFNIRHNHRDADYKATMTVYLPSDTEKLTIDVSLRSGRDRQALVKQLIDLTIGGGMYFFPWGDMLDVAFNECIKRRKLAILALPGTVNINAPAIRPDVPHIFEVANRGKMIPEGTHTTIFSQGGSGKSLLCDDYLPLLFSAGMPDALFMPNGMGNVLVCDWEADEEVHRRNITAIKRSLKDRLPDIPELDNSFIHYMQFTQPITDVQETLKDYIREHDINLGIFDSQMAAMAGAFPGMKDDQLAGIYYNILTSLEITTITIDHVPKSAMREGIDLGTGTAYGSVVKHNRARSVFELKQAQEPGDDFIDLAFVHQKNNLGPKLKTFGMRIKFTNNEDGVLHSIEFNYLDITDSAKLERLRPMWERARDSILWEFQGRANIKELADAIDTAESSLRTCLNRYSKIFVKLEKRGKEGDIWGVKDELKT